MAEDKWADLMSQLMKIAKDLFDSVEDFQKGKLIAEVQAEKNVRIEIARDSDGRINASLGILPSLGEEKERETRGEEAEIPREETASPQETVEEKKEEIAKEDIEVLDIDEEKEDLPSLDLGESGSNYY